MIDFQKMDGLVPVIIQDAKTGMVLMLGYMNEAAYEKTVTERRVTFFSRSKQRLWTKGETSGHFLEVVDIAVDCDVDSLLIQVHPKGPTCHNGTDSCFAEARVPSFLHTLEQVIEQRIANPSESSYTTQLFQKGINKIAQKVGEEAVELVIEAKDNDKDLFLNEAADLMFHFLLLLQAKGQNLTAVESVLRERHR